MLFQIAFTLLTICALLIARRRVQQGALHAFEGWVWGLSWLGATVLVWRPETTSFMARFFGIGRGVDFIVYAAVIFLFFLFFKVVTTVDRMERQITRLIQHEALEKFERERHS